MKIDLNTPQRQRIGRVQLTPGEFPSAVHIQSPQVGGAEHYLDWDKAIDDEGHLRKCPACGCEGMYVVKTFPTMTTFIVVLVISVVCAAMYGLTTEPGWPVVVAVMLVIVASVFFRFWSPRHLVCYRCASEYHGAGISHDRTEWDATTEEKFRNP